MYKLFSFPTRNPERRVHIEISASFNRYFGGASARVYGALEIMRGNVPIVDVPRIRRAAWRWRCPSIASILNGLKPARD